MASEQARRLAGRGHKVTVLTQRTREVLPISSVEGNLIIHRYGSPEKLARLGGLSRTDLSEVPKILTPTLSPPSKGGEREGWDVAILHHPFSALGFFRAGLKIPSLYIFHTSTAREAEVEGIRRQLPRLLRWTRPFLTSWFIAKAARAERIVLERASRIAVLSDFSWLILRGAYPFTEKKIIKLPIGIDVKTFVPSDRARARARLGLPLEKKIILTVRRFTPRMGLFELLRAMEIVLEKIPETQLYIIGEGPLKQDLGNEIQTRNLQGKVILVGAAPVADLPLYYQAADLFVLPTAAFEGLGMSTLEALACGLPVVGTPAGATPEILGALDPTLVTHSVGAKDIATGILGFFARSETEQLALSKKAREIAEQNYNWDRAVEELERVIGMIAL